MINKPTPAIDRILAFAVEELQKEKRKTCLECIHFDRSAEICIPAGQRPPAIIIAYGCNVFEWDGIPF